MQCHPVLHGSVKNGVVSKAGGGLDTARGTLLLSYLGEKERRKRKKMKIKLHTPD